MQTEVALSIGFDDGDAYDLAYGAARKTGLADNHGPVRLIPAEDLASQPSGKSTQKLCFELALTSDENVQTA
jgi:hypothetical protein